MKSFIKHKLRENLSNPICNILKSGATGDSEVDESDTWWSAITSRFCR